MPDPVPGGKIRVPLSIPRLSGNEWRYVKEALDDGWVSSAGPRVARFEERAAEYVGTDFAVATVNGTSAIHAALLSLGVGPGDRVAAPSLTFVASVNPIVYCGAEPVFVDSDPRTGLMDPAALGGALYSAEGEGRPVKAVIAVHLFGHPADMDGIMAEADRRGIPVIEDAAESLGSESRGRRTGAIGRIGCLSFNGNKMVTSGAGGMVVTRDRALADRVHYLTTQARDDPFEYRHDEVGYNYRMSELSAALGLAQLEQAGAFLEARRRNAARYIERFEPIDGVRLIEEPPGCLSNYWVMALVIERDDHASLKPRIVRELLGAGIESRPFFMPVHSQRPYRGTGTTLPNAEALHARGLNLPNHTDVRREDIERMAACVEAASR